MGNPTDSVQAPVTRAELVDVVAEAIRVATAKLEARVLELEKLAETLKAHIPAKSEGKGWFHW